MRDVKRRRGARGAGRAGLRRVTVRNRSSLPDFLFVLVGGARTQISYNASSVRRVLGYKATLGGRVRLVRRSALLHVLAKGFVEFVDRFFYEDIPSERK